LDLPVFERRTDPLLPRRKFFGRLMFCATAGAGILAISMFIDALGYHSLR
jgi:hypothetical protein